MIFASSSLRSAAALCLAVAGLVACGGSGGGGGGGAAGPGPGHGPGPGPGPTAPDVNPTVSPSGTRGGGGGAETLPDAVNSPSNAAVVGAERTVAEAATLAIAGVQEVPARAAALAATPGGRLFHVDSRNGSDSDDGLTESTGSAGRGPWRTLGRLQTSGLLPGDRVQLACASAWNETLRLPASGTAALPITVSGPPAGCDARPAIDGSALLPAADWAQHQGAVYRASLAATPLALSSATATPWTEAHHPNRGHQPSEPGSLYLAAAADSVVSLVNGQRVSTAIEVGRDLQMPAGASLGPGTRARIRLYAWTMQELPVSGFDGRRLALFSPTTYPLDAGWGYYLLGQRWMVDSTGEWFHDAAAAQLYVQMPPDGVPAGGLRATVLATGIDLRGRSHVVVDGVAVRRVGVGADLRDSQAVQLRNLRLDDTATMGIDATASTGLTVESCAFNRIGTESVSGWRHDLGASAGLVVRNNVIRESGVQMQGDEVLSLPRFSYAAIYGGPGSVVTGNTVVNTGYIGIQVMGASLVEKNFVFGACSVLDDCAGIYTQTSSNTVIRGNTVVHSRGALAGKAPQARYTQAQGIYLDESIDNALVEDNTVVDTDNGIQVHDSTNNTVRGNRLYANRRSQIWLQETRRRDNPSGDLWGNRIEGNQIAPVTVGAVGLWLDTILPGTAHFGSIDGNRYFDRAAPVVVRESTAGGTRDFTLAQWQRSTDASLPAGHDTTGTGTSATGHAAFSAAGANIVPNAGVTVDTAGWTTWNETAPLGQLTRQACPAGQCLRYLAGGSPGLVSTPNFSVQQGQWYRLSVDVATEQEAQTLRLVVRRGGGGNNGYDTLSERNLAVVTGRAWQRHTMLFQATASVNARDPLTGDLGARVDIEPLEAGRSVSFANLELVAVTLDTSARISLATLNAGAAALVASCPLPAASAADCTKLRSLGDHSAVTWPLALPASSTLLLYAQEPRLLDSDGDGIADTLDQCAFTPAGAGVNARGCPLTLR